jgi:hypothetical protein
LDFDLILRAKAVGEPSYENEKDRKGGLEVPVAYGTGPRIFALD